MILYEGDTRTVRKIVKRTDYLSQLMDVFRKKSTMEKPVALKYIKINPNCILLPYEWELRNKYHLKHRLRKNSKELINSVIRLYNDGDLTNAHIDKIDKFLELNTQYYKVGVDDTMSAINNVTVDSIIELRQEYIYKIIPEIAKSRIELSDFSEFIPIHMEYWDKRNQAMVQNILKQIKLNPNKTIVILNGFTHRYYLIRELKKYQSEYDFLLSVI